jgi:dihydroxyacid dehydratase/phosphogluconate dehydratase
MVVTPLMDWYKEDFTGAGGIPAIINAVLKQNVAGYAITFSEYNWKEDLRNFTKE